MAFSQIVELRGTESSRVVIEMLGNGECVVYFKRDGIISPSEAVDSGPVRVVREPEKDWEAAVQAQAERDRRRLEENGDG